jgi:hypothetical protein
MVSVTDATVVIPVILTEAVFFQVAPQLYSRGLMDPVPVPLLRKSGSAGNITRTSESVARNSDH